ncbi:hypothetical protein HMPREF9628_01286 [Peptoanaerobacter stomatis]|uniref:Uncharacterized protein n=2 Tax=Peptoanaerobacter stomatis TaxID=796937 RepID=G9XBB9_9FIRM|nr:hypothetical protein HMPREF9628_01286 [Peptoanaerobacter stomatis]
MLIFFKTILEVIFMQRRKHKLSARLQIYIEVQALDISLKAKTIDDTPNHKMLRELILEDCKIDYNCDGYGEPLAEEKSE